MYDYITGKIISKTATHIVLECAGIGYQVNISLNTYSKIQEGTQCKIFTHLAIKEDAHTLEKRLIRRFGKHLLAIHFLHRKLAGDGAHPGRGTFTGLKLLDRMLAEGLRVLPMA